MRCTWQFSGMVKLWRRLKKHNIIIWCTEKTLLETDTDLCKFINKKLADYLSTFSWSTSHVRQNLQPCWNSEIIEDRKMSQLILLMTDDPEMTSFSRQQFLLSGRSLPEINDKIMSFSSLCGTVQNKLGWDYMMSTMLYTALISTRHF